MRFVREQARSARGARGGRRGGGRRRRPAADDPRREGARVQGRRRRRRGPARRRARRRTRSSACPTAASASASPIRRPASAARPPTTRRSRRSRRRRRGGAAAPLLRRDDARDRPADRVRLDRPGARRRTSRRRSAGCSRGSRRRSSTARPTGRSRSSATARGSSCVSTASTARSRRSRRRRGGGGAARALRARERRAGDRCDAPDAARARAAAGAAGEPRATALVQRARALRALLVPLLRRADRRAAARRGPAGVAGTARGLAATEIGDAVHVLLEQLDLRVAAPARRPRGVRARALPGGDRRGARADPRPRRGLLRVGARARLASPRGAAVERSFAFEHDGVLLHGRLDVLPRGDGRALVVDYKTNVLEDATPAEVVEREYRLQRLVYALACLRAGAERGRGRLPVPRAAGRPRRRLFSVGRRAGAGGGAVGGDRGDPGGRVPADAERVRLRRLPRARPRLRGPACALGMVA